jgi:hypothetical protein
MRPKSIVWFERLYVLSVTLPFLVGFREFGATWTTFGPLPMLILLVLFLILPMILALLVSRRRSRVALTFLILITWPVGFLAIAALLWLPLETLTDIAQFLALTAPTAVTLLLVAPSVRAWLKASAAPPVSPEKLERTFE